MKLIHLLTGEHYDFDRWASRMARMRRRIFAWAAHAQQDYSDRPHDLLMATLTYRVEEKWERDDVAVFTKWVRGRWAVLAYAWVMELTRVGKPHYHVALVVERPYPRIRPDEEGGWEKGLTRVEKARTAYYIAKYTSKGVTSDGGCRMPKHARLFCVWASRARADTPAARAYRDSGRPKWVIEAVQELGLAGEPKRDANSRWVCDGVELRCPWRFVL